MAYRVPVAGLLIGFASLLSGGAAAQAADPWREVSFGATAQTDAWSVYASTTVAPLGSLHADGWRLRLGSGYGHYSYDVPRHCYDRIAKVELTTCPATSVKGRVSFGDILAGYQISHGRFTAKAFVGVAIDTQALSPWDTGNASGGRATGWKAAVETWTNLTRDIWLQADAGTTSAHDGTNLLLRLGYRLTPALSVGLEEDKVRNIAGHRFRSGLFARYEWADGEAVIAGGISGEHHDYADRTPERAWGAVSVMLRY